jgi:phospholipid N-methyltransferase
MGKVEKGPSGNHHLNNHAPKATGRASELLLFARNFVKYPDMVGWMLPSSPFVVDAVLKQVDWDKARVVVEYGPGVGTFTTRVLERMRPDAILIALEINSDFCRFLTDSVRDPRLKLVQESATEVQAVLTRLGFDHADYVISGIPFKTLPHAMRGTIVRNTHSALKPEGSFLVYQLSSVVLPYLQQVFTKVSRDSSLLSFLPARMFYCAR